MGKPLLYILLVIFIALTLSGCTETEKEKQARLAFNKKYSEIFLPLIEELSPYFKKENINIGYDLKSTILVTLTNTPYNDKTERELEEASKSVGTIVLKKIAGTEFDKKIKGIRIIFKKEKVILGIQFEEEIGNFGYKKKINLRS